MQLDKESLIWIGIILIPLILWILPAKRFRDDPDKSKQQEFAKQMLRGEKTPEEIAEKEHFDPEHIKRWRDEYAALVVDCVFHAGEIDAALNELAADNELLRMICQEYIGDDWETKTGFKK
ncbi:MAG: hypothetical protein NC093_04640 [Alistipes sp.]|nr:hypothetical protein [Alistipes sp.]